MNSWLEILMIVVSFCGHNNACRQERIACMRNGAVPQQDALQLVDECLKNPKFKPAPAPVAAKPVEAPKAKASPAPQPSAAPSSVPAPAPSKAVK